MLSLRTLDAPQITQHLDALCALLVACVEAGASVSFLAGLTPARANNFFSDVASSAARGERIVIAAFSGDTLVGSVQVVTATPENQPHRADIAKLLVLPFARRQGIGSQLMRYAEDCSRRAGKSLLVLDTVTGGDAERLYQRLGWQRVGVIPNYALLPNGVLCGTTIFWKHLNASAAEDIAESQSPGMD